MWETKLLTKTTSFTPSSYIGTPTLEIMMNRCHQQRRIKMLIYHLCRVRRISYLMAILITAQLCFVQITKRLTFWKEAITQNSTPGCVLLCIDVTPRTWSWKMENKWIKHVHQELTKTSSLKRRSCSCISTSKSLIWELTMPLIVEVISLRRTLTYTTPQRWATTSHHSTNTGCTKARSNLTRIDLVS